MIKKLFLFLVSSLCLILILFMSFWLNISEEKLHSWTQYQLNRATPNPMHTEIDGMQTRFWGLGIDRLELTNPKRRESLLKVTNLKIRFDLVAIVFKQELPFEYQLYGGSGNGTFGFFPNITIALKASDLELNWVPIVRQSQILQSNPVVNFTGRYVPKTESGVLSLSINNLKISGDKSNTMLTMDLPDTVLTTIQSDFTLKQNDLMLDLNTTGDITAKLKGKIMGNWQRIQRSKVDVTLQADLTDPYQDKLGFLNNILASYRQKNGKISVRLTGNLMLPQIRKI